MAPCVLCEAEIAHPLCAACSAVGVASWLQEVAPERPELLFGLAEVTDSLLSGRGETYCIKCHSFMDVCTACYAMHVLEWLAVAAPNLTKPFKELSGLRSVLGALHDAPSLRGVRPRVVVNA